MRIVFGLGNPGLKYKNTRHNLGRRIVEELARAQGSSLKRSFRLAASLAKFKIEGEPVILVRPQTYMNNSGRAARKVLAKYKVDLSDILVIYDEVDLAWGAVRFRKKGSCAGHQGMASIIKALASDQISRLRLGIGRPAAAGDLADYVLADFSRAERGQLEEVVQRAASACRDWIRFGTDYAMSHYNAGRMQ